MKRCLAAGAAACVVFAAAPGAAQPGSGPETCLDVQPEYSRTRGGSGKFLVATLHEKVPGSDQCDGPIVERGDGVWIDFELSGANDPEGEGPAADSPDTPDATCRIDPEWVIDATCTIPLWGQDAGRQLVRAWIDEDGGDPPAGVTEADRDEGDDETSEPGSGCILAGDGAGPAEGEPDCTDVVFVDWKDPHRCYRADESAGPQRIAILRRAEGAEGVLATVDPVSADVRVVASPGGFVGWVWSPDRKRIVYATGGLDGSKLWVTRRGQDVQLTPKRRLDESPAWSPDSRRIAYESYDYRAGEPEQLYVVGVDGSGPKRLTSGGARSTDPDWSPDGRRIVFARYRDTPRGARGGILTIAPDGSRLARLLTGHAAFRAPQYSPDGRSILFLRSTSGTAQLFVMRTNGSRVRRVTQAEDPIVDYEWSPDGTRIMYETTSTSGWNELVVIDRFGRRARTLVRHFGLGVRLSASWSPGSSYVAYELPYESYEPGSEPYPSDVWIQSLEHLCSEVLTNTRDVVEHGPMWVSQSGTGEPSGL